MQTDFSERGIGPGSGLRREAGHEQAGAPGWRALSSSRIRVWAKDSSLGPTGVPAEGLTDVSPCGPKAWIGTVTWPAERTTHPATTASCPNVDRQRRSPCW